MACCSCSGIHARPRRRSASKGPTNELGTTSPDPGEFELDGRLYTWNGWRWLTSDDRSEPPRDIIRRLGLIKRRSTRTAEDSITNPQALLGIAISARLSSNPGRAEKFARRVLELDPEDATAAAIVSSILREKGRPKAALALADRFQSSGDAYVLTSRSAALADLGRWDEALAQVRVVFVIEKASQGAPSEESLAVYGRIRANAPHLFSNVGEEEDDYVARPIHADSPLAASE